MTPITDELVREFFNKILYPKYANDMIENWTDFLASKQAKDWEVVSFARSKSPKDIWVLDDGEYKYYTGSKWSFGQMMNDAHCSVKTGEVFINEVRRLTDNTLFSIGEVTQEGKIEKFEIEAGTIMWARIPEDIIELHKLHKLPERKPVFKTRDDKDIFIGDSFWIVANFEAEPREFKANQDDDGYWGVKENNGVAKSAFSTRSAAEEYVREHKPDKRNAMLRDVLTKGYYSQSTVKHILELLDNHINP